MGTLVAMTPEEKLLRVIRKQDNPVYEKTGGKESVLDEAQDSDAQIPDIPIKKKRKRLHFIIVINRFLTVVVIGIVGCIFAKYVLLPRQNSALFGGLSENLGIKRGRDAVTRARVKDDEIKPFSFYRERIEERNIFQTPWEKAKSQKKSGQNTGSSFAKRFRVVGILLDENPTAIIEDLKSKQTIFMGIGEDIEGARLKEVREDRVIFIYNEQEVELKP